jgi:Plavaka transposase
MASEEMELWRRDPVECIRELIGNPTFKDLLAYAPEQAFQDEEGNIRIFDEMWTGDWWWDLQVSIVIASAKNQHLTSLKSQRKSYLLERQ